MSNVNQFSLCAGFLAVALGSAEAQVRLLTDPPDFAVEMRTGNLVGPLCGPDGYWRGKIADAIRSQVGATADVRSACAW